MGAGEPCFLPQQFRTHKPIASPIEYTHRWVSEVAGQFQGGVCEVRSCRILSSNSGRACSSACSA